MELISFSLLGVYLSLHQGISLEANISRTWGTSNLSSLTSPSSNVTGGLVDNEGLIFLIQRLKNENISRVIVWVFLLLIVERLLLHVRKNPWESPQPRWGPLTHFHPKLEDSVQINVPPFLTSNSLWVWNFNFPCNSANLRIRTSVWLSADGAMLLQKILF